MARPQRNQVQDQGPSEAPDHPHLRLYTPAEAGVILGDVSESHVYRLIAEGELRAVDVSRKGARKSKTRVRSDDLEQYINDHTRSTPPRRRGHGGEAA